MDCSHLTDDEINIRVGESFGWNAHSLHPDGSVTFRNDKGQIKGRKNYCNNPADAWSIIVDNKISLLSVELLNGYFSWLAKNKACPSRGDNNPLRAAMIVFLMMQDSANVQDNPA